MLLWDIVVFWLIAYLLNIICLIPLIFKKKSYIYTFWYNFDTVFYQFLETRISDRTLLCLDQLLRFSGFSLHALLFFFYSPFKSKNIFGVKYWLGKRKSQKLYFRTNKQEINIFLISNRRGGHSTEKGEGVRDVRGKRQKMLLGRKYTRASTWK